MPSVAIDEAKEIMENDIESMETKEDRDAPRKTSRNLSSSTLQVSWVLCLTSIVASHCKKYLEDRTVFAPGKH